MSKKILSNRKAFFGLASALCLLTLTSNSVWSSPFNPVQQQIDREVRRYINGLQDQNHEQVEIEVTSIDPRLRLDPCPSSLDMEHRPSNRVSGRLTLKIACHAPSQWVIHVPVAVKLYATVVVAKTPIAMGTQLNASALKLESRDISLMYQGYFQNLGQVEDLITKRPIPSGQVINPSLVDPAKMIVRGEKVLIVAESSGLNIRTTGVAMDDGSYGDLIRVKNSKSSRVVEGRVTAPGKIEVSL